MSTRIYSQANIVILHGWGASSQSFNEVKKLLEKEGFSVEIPDLPGFGDTPLVRNPMTFDDYVAFVQKYIGNRKVILLAHSFGARVAIAFAGQNPQTISKLILTGASGVPHPLSVKKQAGSFIARAGKIIFSVPGFSYIGPALRKFNYTLLGEMDYYTAGNLKDTFKNVYRTDVRPFLAKISCPTLLVWGENDFIIPVSDGEYIRKNIKSASLIIVKGGTHKLPYEMPHVFVEKILPFLK